MLLVAGAAAGAALWILLATLVPGCHRGRRGAWALHRASRLLLRALRVRPTQQAGPRSGASLIVANDASWIDVLVLSATGPLVPVVGSDVAGWPLLGTLARRSGAIFIDRHRPSGLPHEVHQITRALRRGDRVLVFPAGDQGESGRNPFRRAVFQAAVDAAVVVSPVAVCYRDSHGNLMTPCAFIGDTVPITSLIDLLAQRVTAAVTWLPVIPAIVAGGHPSADRARVAAAAQRSITRASQPPSARPLPISNPSDHATAAPPVAGVDAVPAAALTPRAA